MTRSCSLRTLNTNALQRSTQKCDPDVAGIGITTSILITAAASIITVGCQWYLYRIRGDDKSVLQRTLTRFTFALGDIQLVIALAIIIASLKIIYTDAKTSHLRSGICSSSNLRVMELLACKEVQTPKMTWDLGN